MSENKIVAEECRFAIHIPSRHGSPDFHLVKKRVHFEDGTTAPKVDFIKDYKRPFAVTAKRFQNHEQKKESEKKSKLQLFTCTQSDLQREVARALGMGWSNKRLSELSRSPYLYGSDISSTTLIKHEINSAYKGDATHYSVAFGDIETDVLHKTDDPIITSLTFEDRMELVVDRKFLEGEADVEERYFKMLRKYLGPELDELGLKPTLKIVDGPVELMKSFIHPLHDYLPDFLAFWNMDFDIPRLLDTCKKYNYSAEDLFCHPTIPKDIRFCRYRKGSTKKITASGQVKPKNPSEQWHSLNVPASFYVIDPMSSYRFIRQGAQEESSYSLHDILMKWLNRGKLKIAHTENGDGLDWHVEMQAKHKIEYLVYAAFDTIGMALLDKKTKDLSMVLPIQAESTDFARFNSQSKRFSDDYHFYLWNEKNEVISTIPPKEEEGAWDVDTEAAAFEDGEEDEEVIEYDEDGNPTSRRDSVLSLRDWIITLKPHMAVRGLKGILKEEPELNTLFRFFVYDSDAVSAYPSCVSAANVSLQTTLFEVIDVIGRREEVFRSQNINLLQGHVNALEYCNEMFRMPTPQEALALFEDM